MKSLKLPPRLPRPFLLNALYRCLMQLSGNHGLLTLARLNSRLFPRGEIVRLPTGNEFYVPGDPHFIAYVLARHEDHITRIMQETIKPGDTCIDIGANLGYFTCIMAALCPGGSVLSFEPEPSNYQVLLINAEAASAFGVRMLPFQAAASNKTSRMELIRGEKSGMHKVGVAPTSRTAELVDAFCPAEISEVWAKPVKFLKIDVEGHEAEVLEGCSPLFDARHIRNMIIEVFPGRGAEKVDTLLRKWNPKVRCWVANSWRHLDIRSLEYRTDVFVEFTSC